MIKPAISALDSSFQWASPAPRFVIDQSIGKRAGMLGDIDIIGIEMRKRIEAGGWPIRHPERVEHMQRTKAFPRLRSDPGILALILTVLSVAIGFHLGLGLAVMRMSERRLVANIAKYYSMVFRSTPLLVQLFLFYYGLAQIPFIKGNAVTWWIVSDGTRCAVMAIALNTAAYTSEILRGGLLSIPVGLKEAAKASGMSRFTSFRRIEFPLAIRQALPAYGNELILVVKGTSLASTITVLEITGYAKRLMSQTFAIFEVFTLAGIITRIAIKLEPLPASTATALFGLPSTQAALSVMRRGLKVRYGHLRAAEAIWSNYFRLTSTHHNWSAAEYRTDHPINLLLCLGGNDDADVQSEVEAIYEDVSTHDPDISAVIASSKAQERAIWAPREDTDLIYRRHPGAPSYDVSVPLSEVEAYMNQRIAKLKALDPELDPYVFGHLADGNLHIVLNAARDTVDSGMTTTIEDILYSGLHPSGGSFSAEHGIGSKRAETLIKNTHPGKMMLMKQVKACLDPRGMLNPGKVLLD